MSTDQKSPKNLKNRWQEMWKKIAGESVKSKHHSPTDSQNPEANENNKFLSFSKGHDPSNQTQDKQQTAKFIRDIRAILRRPGPDNDDDTPRNKL